MFCQCVGFYISKALAFGAQDFEDFWGYVKLDNR